MVAYFPGLMFASIIACSAVFSRFQATDGVDRRKQYRNLPQS
jgi:hypothetical protein